MLQAEDAIIEIDSPADIITVLRRLITEDRNANTHIAGAVNRTLSFDNLPTDKIHIFSVLLNSIICLYHVACHRQLIDVRRYNIIYIFITLYMYLTYY